MSGEGAPTSCQRMWFVDYVGTKALNVKPPWILLKSTHRLPQSNHHPPTPLALPLFSLSALYIMNNLDPTDAQVVAWMELFDAMSGLSDAALLESIQEDLLASAPGHFSSAASGSELPNLNAVSDTAFTLASTTSMGAFTNFASQINYTYPVSKPRF